MKEARDIAADIIPVVSRLREFDPFGAGILTDLPSSLMDTDGAGLPETTLTAPSPFALRAQLHEKVLLDLQGPAGGPHEELTDSNVRERYLVGMLAARKQRDAPEDADTLEVAEQSVEDGPPEPSIPPAGTLLPSSFGLSFCVSTRVEALWVTARWGWYRREKSEIHTTEKTGAPATVWKRHPVEGSWRLSLREGALPSHVVDQEQPLVTVRGLARRRGDFWIVTLFLVNDQEEPKQTRDESWLFQPELVVEGVDGAPVFCQALSAELRRESRDPEQITLAMQYRHRVEFAAGHGVSVHAETPPDDTTGAIRLSTRVVPAYEVAQQTPRSVEECPDLAGLELDMKSLAEATPEQLAQLLAALPDAYAEWIKKERLRLNNPSEGLEPYRSSAEAAFSACDEACRRLRAGLKVLKDNGLAAEAFIFANRAMWLQRVHTLYTESVRRGGETPLEAFDVPRNRSWRPFQLAFILLNLPGLADVHHPERTNIADLLWFPTGGGKTEAYLGLTAFTLAYRRLQGIVGGRSGDEGVAVLMRYTLRLLTLQQFQRAAALICACESIRRERREQGDRRLGEEPFRIGLWVGMRTTPNTTDQSAESLRDERGQRHAGAVGGSGSPVQLVHCPWCGTRIQPGRDVRVEVYGQGQARTLTFCGDTLGRCLFSPRNSPQEGLPIIVVDEEIYRRLPALLISTVDKFAQMPWRGDVGMLFGMVNARCPRHGFRSPEIEDSDSHTRKGSYPAVRSVEVPPLRPPDLIIQDELHLISGPLGTLVGLYETAIDELCSWDLEGTRVRPKIIASTATIRRAREQVRSLFNREVRVFPPLGTSADDNFFSKRREPSEDVPGRLYIGICAPGKRFKAALIRVYTAYLSAAQQLFEQYGRHADPWMTQVGYFNSIRELGGMRRLVEDDIRQRLRDMDQRGLAKRTPRLVKELTSRIGATDIPEILDLLEVPFDPETERLRKQRRQANERVDLPLPIDVLLATNMISVGVDVRRLGLMTVAGQPKTTAEYIQATSRVGRNAPGLVCTVFNWARPRDLSHYERFEHYHATYYQHVEALSITPFASRARDRGLAGVLVSLIRLCRDDYNDNDRAGAIQRLNPIVQQAVETLVQRAEVVTGSRQEGEKVLGELQKLLDDWGDRALRPAGGGSLFYREQRGAVAVPLLQKPGLGPRDRFTCLTSLRDVEPSIALILDDRRMDADAPEATRRETIPPSTSWGSGESAGVAP